PSELSLLPYTTLFRSFKNMIVLVCLLCLPGCAATGKSGGRDNAEKQPEESADSMLSDGQEAKDDYETDYIDIEENEKQSIKNLIDRKSTRLNSSHVSI